MAKFCVECGESIRSKASVCPNCGCDQDDPPTRGDKHCSECGEVVRAKAVVCPYCGCGQTMAGRTGVTTGKGNLEKMPGKITAIAWMTLAGGGFAIFWSLIAFVLAIFLSGCVCCLWPGFYYGIVVGIMAIIKGSSLLNSRAGTHAPPTGIAIMQIINIVSLDVVNLGLGIATLVISKDEEVEAYFDGKK
jgi:RNA polymerase subunit RPABC4/transcription elongation factor Spt4